MEKKLLIQLNLWLKNFSTISTQAKRLIYKFKNPRVVSEYNRRIPMQGYQ